MTSFGKHPGLLVRGDRPFNAEPPLGLLRQWFVTPTELFYVRNHGDVPAIDVASYRLSVAGLVERTLELSLDELRSRFPRTTVAATFACAGNRRQELMRIAPIPGELAWAEGVVGNAEWTGVRLKDVLSASGLAPGASHIGFEGLDEANEAAHAVVFGGSIPLAKAMSPETILAYEMNGKPLPEIHGFPLRAIVPGYIGARSVKWLSTITAETEPSQNYFQSRSYKLFPPDVTPETADWTTGRTLGETSVNSVICRPADGEVVVPGAVRVEGWALPAAGASLERVDVSVDRGETWTTADLLPDGDAWTWRFWFLTLELEPGPHEVVVRAYDSAGNTQPEDPRPLWNFKGYANNAWHRVQLTAGERAAPRLGI